MFLIIFSVCSAPSVVNRITKRRGINPLLHQSILTRFSQPVARELKSNLRGIKPRLQNILTTEYTEALRATQRRQSKLNMFLIIFSVCSAPSVVNKITKRRGINPLLHQSILTRFSQPVARELKSNLRGVKPRLHITQTSCLA